MTYAFHSLAFLCSCSLPQASLSEEGFLGGLPE